MALNLYLDAGLTEQMFVNQVFAGTGSQVAFTLGSNLPAGVASFSGAQLQAVYVETFATFTGITAASGVLSGFSGLTVNGLIGQRVILNGTFQGTVVSNTATTVTISNSSYTYATASTCIISNYVIQPTTAYSVNLTTNVVTMNTAPTTSQNLHMTATSDLALSFGGTTGTVKNTQSSFYLARATNADGSMNTYDTLFVQCQDNSQAQYSLTQTGITFASGVGSGFTGLVAGALIGRACVHNGNYQGVVTANTTTTVTISNLSYTDATAASCTLYTIGSLQFAPDVSGSPGTFAPVIQPSAITTNAATRIWVEDTVTVPTNPINYPNNVVNVTGIGYVSST
jgi:hypothetical protein